MRVKFPVFTAVEHDWTVLAHGDATDIDRIVAFLQTNFSDSDVVVHISRKVGGLMPIKEAAQLIKSAVGKAEVRVANRAFTELAVVGQPGVGTAWKLESAPHRLPFPVAAPSRVHCK